MNNDIEKWNAGAYGQPFDLAECACCIVEYLAESETELFILNHIGENAGAACRRQFIITELAPFIEKAYLYAIALDYDEPFDWEFVPSALAIMQGWTRLHDDDAKPLAVQIVEFTNHHSNKGIEK